MEIITLSLKIIFILFFVGYGFTSIFLPDKFRKDSLIIIPWLGIVFTILFGVALSFARFPLSQGKSLILLTGLILIIYSVIKKRLILTFSKSTLVLGLFTFILLIFNLFPLISKMGFPTTISLGNLDPLSYANVGDFLIKNSLLDGNKIIHFEPHLWAVGDLLYYSFRWGSPLFLGFISSLLNVKSYEVYYILMSILFSLTFPLVYLLSTQFYSKKSYLLMIIIFMTYGMNSILLYMLYNVFLAQFLFSGVYILILILLLGYFNEKNKEDFSFNSYDLLIGFCISSITSIYPEGLVFVLIPLAIYLAFKLLTNERLTTLISLSKILLIIILINPITLGTALSWNYKIFFLTTRTDFIGWERVRYATPFEMTGFYNLFYYKNLPLIFDVFISIPVIILFSIGFYKIKNKLLLFSFLLFFLILYFFYRFIYPNYYAHLKTVSLMVFIFSGIFSVGVLQSLKIINNKIVLLILIIFMSFLSIRSAHRTMSQLYYHQRSVDKKLISLEELNNNKKIKEVFFTSDVFLGDYDLWKRLWQEYLLNNKKIITKTNFTSETEDSIKKTKLVLSEKGFTEFGNKKIIYKKIIWENQYYQLGEIEPLEIKM